MTSEAAPRASLVAALEVIAEEAGEDGVSLKELMESLGERAFGAILFVLALPCCIPFLYLVPQIVALPMMVFALQLVAGRAEPWLPGRFAVRRIDKAGLTRMARAGRRFFGWAEVFARPRLLFLTGAMGDRVIGVFLVLFCASILTPIPLTNSTPAFGVALASFGMIERDGVLTILGLIIGTAWIVALVSLAALGVRALT